MKINFKCQCGSRSIEEVLENVFMYSTMADIEKLEDNSVSIDYGDNNTDYGELSHYQCTYCGKAIQNHSGLKISCPEELYEWLEHNNMLKEE